MKLKNMTLHEINIVTFAKMIELIWGQEIIITQGWECHGHDIRATRKLYFRNGERICVPDDLSTMTYKDVENWCETNIKYLKSLLS